MTACREDAAWLGRHLQARLAGVRFPLTGTFELTQRCNFSCPHCYLGPRRAGGPELGSGAIQALLDQAAGAGCLSLALTGGEPLLRADFPAIWRHAHRLGFLLSLFTNGSLLGPEAVALLADHPPRVVEISLYGAGRAGYAALTGDGEHFQAVLEGIDRLLARGIRVALKAVLLAPLAGELEGLRALGGARGLEVRLDPGVHRTLDGDVGPSAQRLVASAAVAEELATPGARARLATYDRAWRAQPEAARRAPCAAGYHAFHLDPEGRLMACMLHRAPAPDAARLGFSAAWEALGEAGRLSFQPGSACVDCPLGHLCGYCPAVQGLGEEPEFHCEVASARRRVLESDPVGGE